MDEPVRAVTAAVFAKFFGLDPIDKHGQARDAHPDRLLAARRPSLRPLLGERGASPSVVRRSDDEHERQHAGDHHGGAEAHQRDGGIFDPVDGRSRSMRVRLVRSVEVGRHGDSLGRR